MTVVDSSRTTMESYLQALLTRGGFADYLSDDVALEIVGSGKSAHGRTEVAGMIRHIHEQAFDATAKLKSLVVEGHRAAIEADFVGRHTAPSSLASLAPTAAYASLTASTTTSEPEAKYPRCVSTASPMDWYTH